jgi:hypothetical protein
VIVSFRSLHDCLCYNFTRFLFFVNSQYLGGFIPAPIWTVIAIVVPLVVILGVVRFIRGFF